MGEHQTSDLKCSDLAAPSLVKVHVVIRKTVPGKADRIKLRRGGCTQAHVLGNKVQSTYGKQSTRTPTD